MTQIQAKLNDSYGNPLVGYIRITLDYLVTNRVSQETYLPVSFNVPLVDGDALFTLEPSETSGVTYFFEVFRTVVVETATVVYPVYSFRAVVPASLTPVLFTDLLTNTGITHDTRDSSVSTIIRRLYNDDTFWERLKSTVLASKGVYSGSAYYRRGDLVTFGGSSYIYTGVQTGFGQSPTAFPALWQLIGQKGENGSGTTGNNAVYDAATWAGSQDAPSRNTVSAKIETLATKAEVNLKASLASPSFAQPTLSSPKPPLADNSTKIVSTAWIQDNLDILRKALVPVGTIVPYAGTSAPAGWLHCDGRILTQTVFPALFTVCGTLYNTGGEPAGTFRLPDIRGRVVVGQENMSSVQGFINRLSRAWGSIIGASGGLADVTLTIEQMPNHTHQVSDASLGSGGGYFQELSGVQSGASFAGTGVGRPGANVVNNKYTGGGTSHENLQPTIIFPYIIYSGQ